MTILRMLLFIFFLFCFVFLYARRLEYSALYFPIKEIEYTPGDLGLEYEEIFFYAEDNVQLHGWFVPAKESHITVLFCHGNGGNIGHRLDKIKFFNELGVNVFIFDYRGYGKSQGMPSELGLYKDAEAAFKFLKARNQKNKKKIHALENKGVIV